MTCTLRRALWLLCCVPLSGAQAHHSFQGTFQSGKAAQVTGVVTEFHFYNPHVSVYLEATNADGSTTRWMSEGLAASSYGRLGWTRETLKKGDLIRISGDGTRDGSPMLTLTKVELLDPKDRSVTRVLTEAKSEGPRPTATASRTPTQALPLKLSDGRPNLTGAWTEADHSRPPSVSYNDAGKALQATAKIANDPQIFCDPPGLVRQAGFTPHAIRITQFADHVLIEYEEYGGRREIYFAPSKAMSKVKTNLGSSIARYDGDALIIESNNLLANWINPHGDQLSDQTTVVETYRRVDDPKSGAMLSIQLVATDPVYLKQPFVITKNKRFSENYQFIPNECRPPLRNRNTTN